MKRLFYPFIFFILFILVSCGSVEPPQFTGFKDFKLGKITLNDAEVSLAVAYQNPNKFGLSVKAAELDLYLDSVFIGQFSQPKEVVVTKQSEFAIPLKGKVPLQKVLELNLNDLTNRVFLIRASGSVDVGKAGVFVKRPIDYTGRHSINIKL